jgi:hypothetical protein
MRQSRGGLSTASGQWVLGHEAVEEACSAGTVLPYHLVAYLLVKSFCLGPRQGSSGCLARPEPRERDRSALIAVS